MADYNAYISEASRRFGVPEAWIRSVIQSESAGKPNALGPMTRFNAQAQGLMQIMPDTYQELAGKHGLGPDPFDPRNNILGGTAYLGELAQRFGGDPSAVLHAYNMGPNAFEQTRTGPRKVPAETAAYVQKTLPGMQGPWKTPVDPGQQAAFADVLQRLQGTTAATPPGPESPTATPPLPEREVGPPPGGVTPAPQTLPDAPVGLLDQAIQRQLSGLLGEIGPQAPEPTGLPWYDRFAQWATQPPGPLQSSLLGVAEAVAPLSGWRTGTPVSTAQVLAAAAGGLRQGGQDYRQQQMQRLEGALGLEKAQVSRQTAQKKILAAKRYAQQLRQSGDAQLTAIADVVENDPPLMDEVIKALMAARRHQGRGGVKTVNTAEGVFVLNPDGSRGERIGSPTTTARTPQVKTVTLGDGVYVVNPDGSRGARLGDAPPKGAGPKTVTTADGVFVLNPDGTLGSRLGASETAPDAAEVTLPPEQQQQIADEVGLPVPKPGTSPLDRPGLSPRGKVALSQTLQKQNEKRFAENDEAAAAAARRVQQLQRFTLLNESNWTGGLFSAPLTAGTRGLWDAEFKEMQAITAEITPTLRQPGSGATSDFDAKMFQAGTVGVDKPRETNLAIAQGAIAASENLIAKAQFERAYGETYGHLNGADLAWKRYLNANPIFDPTAPKGSYKINSNRQDWQTFFRAERGGAPPAPAPDAGPAPAPSAVMNFDGEGNPIP